MKPWAENHHSPTVFVVHTGCPCVLDSRQTIGWQTAADCQSAANCRLTTCQCHPAVTLIGSRGHFLGFVAAPNEKAAELAAAKLFTLTSASGFWFESGPDASSQGRHNRNFGEDQDALRRQRFLRPCGGGMLGGLTAAQANLVRSRGNSHSSQAYSAS